jgi:hypothetical protein
MSWNSTTDAKAEGPEAPRSWRWAGVVGPGGGIGGPRTEGTGSRRRAVAVRDTSGGRYNVGWHRQWWRFSALQRELPRAGRFRC